MPCHYCGRELYFRSLVDRDFCSASHRRKYHEQIRRNLVEPPAGPPAGIAAFHFELPASNRGAAPVLVSAERVARREVIAGSWAAMPAIEAPLGAAFHAAIAAIAPRRALPAGGMCGGPVDFGAIAENGGLAFRLESTPPELWRGLRAGPASTALASAPRSAPRVHSRFHAYTFEPLLLALPLSLSEPAPGHAGATISWIYGCRNDATAVALPAAPAPALRRAPRPAAPALEKPGVPVWEPRPAIEKPPAPALPRPLAGRAAFAPARTHEPPRAMPPLRADLDAPQDGLPSTAADTRRPVPAPLTISVRPVEPAAAAAVRLTRATAPCLPLPAAGFALAGRRPHVPRFRRPARAAHAPAAFSALRPSSRPARLRFSAVLPVPLVSDPSNTVFEVAPREATRARRIAASTFGCQTPEAGVRRVPALFSPAPERFAPAPSERPFEFKPEASMWIPEPAHKTLAVCAPEPREETVSLREPAPCMGIAVRHGAHPQQLAPEPWTFPCMAPPPVEARIEGFPLAAALKPFEREFKAWAARRRKFQAIDALRYAKLAAAAALVVAAMSLGVLAGIRRTPAAIERRATVEWNENFRSGLKLWRGASSWTTDASGYARPSQLAVFVPSRELSNYRLLFLARIEAKGVSWAFRAQDHRNYHGAELRIGKPGPRPLLELVRYTVTGGRRGPEVRLPLNVMAHNNLPLEVTLEAAGDSFRIAVDGETADEWTDGRLREGGIGFFSDSGSRARIYWMQLTSHPDWLGRLCAFLTGSSRPVTAQVQPAEGDNYGNDGNLRIRRIGARKARVPIHR